MVAVARDSSKSLEELGPGDWELMEVRWRDVMLLCMAPNGRVLTGAGGVCGRWGSTQKC